MKISILNDVLGPILHGPSSSHTAASYSIGRLTHMLCEDEIKEINITFDSKGSFDKTYKSQNGDVAFLSGIINLAVDDPDLPPEVWPQIVYAIVRNADKVNN